MKPVRDIQVYSHSGTEHDVIIEGKVVETYDRWSDAYEHMNSMQSHDRLKNVVDDLIEQLMFWRRFQ